MSSHASRYVNTRHYAIPLKNKVFPECRCLMLRYQSVDVWCFATRVSMLDALLREIILISPDNIHVNLIECMSYSIIYFITWISLNACLTILFLSSCESHWMYVSQYYFFHPVNLIECMSHSIISFILWISLNTCLTLYFFFHHVNLIECMSYSIISFILWILLNACLTVLFLSSCESHWMYVSQY